MSDSVKSVPLMKMCGFISEAIQSVRGYCSCSRVQCSDIDDK